MADINARDAKLVQYLNEAYGKEKQLETALEAHIQVTTRPPYRKRLQQHLKETKTHARGVKQRIKQLGGTPETVNVPGPDVVSEVVGEAASLAQRGAALAQGPLHAMRGTGEEEKQLKNAKTEYQDEAEEIATYTAIETLADTVGDRETAKLARDIKRQEERMSGFLAKLIPQLTKAVAQSEIPAALRNGGTRRRSTSSRRAASTARSGSGSTRGRSPSKTAARSSSRSTSGRKTARRSTTARSGSRAKTARSGSASARRTSGRSTSRSGTARRSTARSGSARRTTSARARTTRGSTGRSRATRSTARRSTSGSRRASSSSR